MGVGTGRGAGRGTGVGVGRGLVVSGVCVAGACGAERVGVERGVTETTDVGVGAATGTTSRGFLAEGRGVDARGRGGVAAGATRITVTALGARSTIAGGLASGTASSMTSFGNAIAAAPPSTASATVSARANISLMELPLPAENTYKGLIGSESGN